MSAAAKHAMGRPDFWCTIQPLGWQPARGSAVWIVCGFFAYLQAREGTNCEPPKARHTAYDSTGGRTPQRWNVPTPGSEPAASSAHEAPSGCAFPPQTQVGVDESALISDRNRYSASAWVDGPPVRR